MYFNPSLILIDLVRLLISYAMYYYITRLEQIKCLKQPSWKPTFIKFYSVVSIILIVLSSVSPMPNTLDIQAVIMSIQLPLSIMLIYTIYTYVRELEKEFKDCNLSNNIEFVHEFLKLYSLLSVLGLVFIVLVALSSVLSFVKFPKYMSLQQKLNNDLRLKIEENKLKKTNNSAINKAVKRVSKDKKNGKTKK
tara:strand:- start:1371 stop:1949 length:579 start_codon:yes stop_codon:yes gene_type:complete